MVFLVVALMFRLYTSMWSYFGFQDCLKYAWAMATGAIIFIPVAFASNEFSFNAFPRSSIPLFFLLLFAIEFGAKSLYRLLFRNHRKTAFRLVPRETCLIIGSVHEADQVIRNLQHSSPEIGHIVGIVTDEHKGLGATLHGSKVLGTLAELERIVATYKPQTLLILPPYDPPGSVTQILDQCAKTTVAPRFQIIPSISDLATGKIDFSTIRNVEIEDLLGRPKVEIETDRLKEFIQAKSVLVTGAGGSIGSELCRQVLRFEPEKLILFENSEFALFNIERELRSQGIGTIVSRIGDVRNKEDVSD
ncbi:MAG: polysaccharide biosynthesis protein, partial [Verrucomicrobiota bacterium]